MLPTALLLLAGTLVIGLTVGIELYTEYDETGQIDIFKPVYPLAGFTFLLFVVRPLYLVVFEVNVIRRPTALSTHLLDAFPYAILYGIVGWVCFYIGFRKTADRDLTLAPVSTALSPRSVFITCWLFVFVGIAGIVGYLTVAFGEYTASEMLFGNTLAIIKSIEGGDVLFRYAGNFTKFSFALAVIALLKYESHRAKFGLLAGLSFGIHALFVGMGGFRFPYLTLVLTPFVIVHYATSIDWRVKLGHVVLAFPAFILSLGWLQGIRSGSWQINWLSPINSLRPFDEFVFLLTSLGTEVDFQYGLQYLYRFSGVAFVPRVIWESKPLISPARVYTDAIYGVDELSTHTLTAVGELYFQFHVVGVILGLAAFGIAWSVAYTKVRRYPYSELVLLAYVTLLFEGINIWRASVGSFFVTVVLLVPVLAVPIVVEYLFRYQRYESDVSVQELLTK